jgi:hypothetical protein
MEIEVNAKISGPAAINRRSGKLILHPSFFDLPEHHRAFVVFHEIGHWKLNTTSEYLADKYAFIKCAYFGYPIANSLQAMADILPGTEEHGKRAQALYEYGLYFDKKTNPQKLHRGSMEARQEALAQYQSDILQEIEQHLRNGDMQLADGAAVEFASTATPDDAATFAAKYLELTDSITNAAAQSSFDGSSAYGDIASVNLNGFTGDSDTDDEDDISEIYGFLGFGKDKDKSKPAKGKNPDGTFDLTTKAGRQAQKRADASAKAQAAADKKRSQGIAKETKASAKDKLAEQGISSGAGIADAIGGALGKIAEVGGKVIDMKTGGLGIADGGTEAQAPDKPKAPEEKKPIHWGWWVGGGVALLAIIALVIYFIRKK